MTEIFIIPYFFLVNVNNKLYYRDTDKRKVVRMEVTEKNNLPDKPFIFRMEQEFHDFIEEEMIRRKVFNKSQIMREIFIVGMETYKQDKK